MAQREAHSGKQKDIVKKKRRPLIVRILLWFGVAFLSIVLVAGLFVTWLTQTGHGRKFLISQVSTVLTNHVFVGDIEARRIEGPIFGWFVLRDVRLHDDQDMQAGYIAEATVHYSVKALLKKHVLIESLDIRDLDLFGRVREDGTMNLGSLFQPGSGEDKPDRDGVAVTIQRLDLDGGNVRIVDERADELVAAFTQPRLVASFRMDGRGAMHAGISELSSTMEFGLAPGAEFAARIDDLTLDIEREDINFAAGRLTLGETGLFGFDGSIQRSKPGSGRLFEHFEALMPQLVFSPDDVRALVPSIPLATTLTIDASIKGPPEELTLNAALSGADQDATARIMVDLTDGVDSQLRGVLDVDEFKPELWLDFPGMTGDLNAKILFSAQGLTPQRLNAELKMLIEPSTLLGYALDSGLLHLTFQKEELQLQELDFRAGRGSLTGNGRASLNGDLALKLQIDVPDLADLQERSPMQGKMNGSFYFDLDASGQVPVDGLTNEALADIEGIIEHVVRHLDISVDLRARNVDTPGAEVQRLDLRLTGKAGEDVWLNLDGEVQEALLGDLDVEKVQLHARIDGKKLELTAAAEALGATVDLGARGKWTPTLLTLDLDTLFFEKGDLQASLRNRAHAEIALSEEGQFLGVSIRDFDLAGEGLALQSKRLRYQANGEIRGDIHARVDNLEGLSELEALVDLKTLGLKGALEASGEIEGSVSRPRYDLLVRADRLHASGVGPVDGSMRAQQVRNELRMDGLLCLNSDSRGATQREDCDGGDVLLRAEALALPIQPGFTKGRPRFNRKGPLAGHAEIGRIQIEKFSGLSPIIKDYNLRGALHLRLYLDGTFDEPNAAAIVDLEDAWVTLPLEAQNPEDATIGPIRTQANLKIANAEGVLSVFHWNLGGSGLEVGGETWARAKGDVEAPVRGFLLGDVSLRDLVADARGTVIALEVPERSLADLPPALLPDELDPDGQVYFSFDVVSHPQFTGAKVAFHGTKLRWDDIGPIELYASGVSSEDTTVRVDVLAEDTHAAASLDAILHTSFGELLRRGVAPQDVLEARVHIPEMTIDDLPVESLRLRAQELVYREDRTISSKIAGYVDVSNTLEDLQISGRIRAHDIMTSSKTATETGLEFYYGTSDGLGFTGGKEPRLQVMATICGPDASCALELVAGAKPGVRSGTFLFGTAQDRQKALERIKQSPYALSLKANDAPLSALLPVWLFADVATNVGGELHADLRVQGDLTSFPEIHGELSIAEGHGEILPLARYIENLELKMRIAPHSFILDTLHIDDGVGTVNAKGHLSSRKGIDAQGAMDFQFERFLLSDGSGLGVYLTASVPIDAKATKDGLNVDVLLENANVYVPDSVISGGVGGPTQVPDNIIFLEEGEGLSEYVAAAERRTQESRREAQLLENVSIPVRVNIRSKEDIRIQQRFADLKVEADMFLRLKNGEIETLGEVNVTSGYAQAFGKRFDVALGRVLFDGGGEGPFDPRLRVEARHRLPRKTAALLETPSGQYASVLVVIDSHVSNLDVKLRSDPVMSESEILNVLLTGKPIETDDAERPEALATAGTLLAGFLTDQLGENPVLDSLTVELDDKDGNLDSRFEGGRYFGKEQRIYATVAYIAGADSNENSVEVSWQFILAQLRKSSLRLELRWGDRRTGAVEFLYDLRIDKGWRLVR